MTYLNGKLMMEKRYWVLIGHLLMMSLTFKHQLLTIPLLFSVCLCSGLYGNISQPPSSAARRSDSPWDSMKGVREQSSRKQLLRGRRVITASPGFPLRTRMEADGGLHVCWFVSFLGRPRMPLLSLHYLSVLSDPSRRGCKCCCFLRSARKRSGWTHQLKEEPEQTSKPGTAKTHTDALTSPIGSGSKVTVTTLVTILI